MTNLKKILFLRNNPVAFSIVVLVAAGVVSGIAPNLKTHTADGEVQLDQINSTPEKAKFMSALLTEGEKAIVLNRTCSAKMISAAASFFGMEKSAEDLFSRMKERKGE